MPNTKRIKLLTGLLVDGGARDPGQVIDWPADDADRLIKKGFAELADKPEPRKGK
jgi:hypothetical protein